MIRPNLRSSLPALLGYASCALLIGCAAATITPQETSTPPATVAQRPDKIVVYDFAVSAANVTPNQSVLQKAYRAVAEDQQQQEASRLAAGREAARKLSQALVKRLQAMGFDAEAMPRGAATGANTMVIDGQFVSASEGNRARRLIIGFGAGASTLDTEVTVSQLSATGQMNQLLNFDTHADSGKMPGAAVTMGAGAAAQGAAAAGAVTGATSVAKTFSSTLSTLADKTAKQIAAYLSHYFASQGWIAADEAQKVKLAD